MKTAKAKPHIVVICPSSFNRSDSTACTCSVRIQDFPFRVRGLRAPRKCNLKFPEVERRALGAEVEVRVLPGSIL